jgi:hypothetical protein
MRSKLLIADATAPFFAVCRPEGAETNWSKVPFQWIEQSGVLTDRQAELLEAFERYVRTLSRIGYNTLTIDDVAHLVPHSFYSDGLNGKIAAYQALYARLFTLAASYGMKVLVNTDVLPFNAAIESHTGMKPAAMMRFFCRSIRRMLKTFPGIEGVVLRLGEADGVDVDGDFHSRLVIRSSRQCRRLVRAVLPLLERQRKLLIVRTWTLGAFPIGDLLWNRDTYDSAFAGIDSESLVVSHKYGEADFFRYLNLNPLFCHARHRKIIEVQARREYEGFGEFPSYIGPDCERYFRYMGLCERVVGLSVWCQTGGWSHFDRLTFVKKSSPWNEINAFVALRIFRDGIPHEEAVARYVDEFLPGKDANRLLDLLRLSERVIKELWYIPEFSSRRMYFRRTRVPPLLWIFWDTILINHTLRKVIRRFVHERREAIHDGYRMLSKVKRMKALAREVGLDEATFDYQYDTFRIVAAAREYYLGPWNSRLAAEIRELVGDYNRKYPHGFHVQCDFSPVRVKKWLIKTIFRLSLRPHPHYRLIDRFFVIRFASLVYPLFHLWQRKRLPGFVREQTMGVQVLFK